MKRAFVIISALLAVASVIFAVKESLEESKKKEERNKILAKAREEKAAKAMTRTLEESELSEN